MQNWQTQNRRFFRNKRSHLDQLVQRTFIDDNQAIIPCHAGKYEDIISPYSVKGMETLNPDFQAYLLDIVRYIPDEYPIVLEIENDSFTDEEKATIESTVKTDMLYALGESEADEHTAFRNFLLMLGGVVGMGIFLTVVNFVLDIAKEFFYIVFWFFADTLVRYVLQDRSAKRYSRMLSGRLASMSVRFKQIAEN